MLQPKADWGTPAASSRSLRLDELATAAIRARREADNPAKRKIFINPRRLSLEPRLRSLRYTSEDAHAAARPSASLCSLLGGQPFARALGLFLGKPRL